MQFLDNAHVSLLTHRATRNFLVRARSIDRFARLRGWLFRAPALAKQRPATSQVLGPKAIGEEAIIADAHEPGREDVQQETTDELGGLQGHRALPTAMRIILPLKRDLAIFQAQQ